MKFSNLNFLSVARMGLSSALILGALVISGAPVRAQDANPLDLAAIAQAEDPSEQGQNQGQSPTQDPGQTPDQAQVQPAQPQTPPVPPTDAQILGGLRAKLLKDSMGFHTRGDFEVFLANGATRFGVLRANLELGYAHQFSNSLSYKIFLDLDARPLIIKEAVKDQLISSKDVANAVEAGIRLELSKRLGVPPQLIPLPPGLVQAQVQDLVDNRINSSLLLETSVRQFFVELQFKKVTLDVGKIDFLHFQDNVGNYNHLSAPTVRVKVQATPFVALYAQASSYRSGAENADGEIYGILHEVLAFNSRHLTYNPNSWEVGVSYDNVSVAKNYDLAKSAFYNVIGAFGSSNGESRYALGRLNAQFGNVPGGVLQISLLYEHERFGEKSRYGEGSANRVSLAVRKEWMQKRLVTYALNYTLQADVATRLKTSFNATTLGADYTVKTFKEGKIKWDFGGFYRRSVPIFDSTGKPNNIGGVKTGISFGK